MSFKISDSRYLFIYLHSENKNETPVSLIAGMPIRHGRREFVRQNSAAKPTKGLAILLAVAWFRFLGGVELVSKPPRYGQRRQIGGDAWRRNPRSARRQKSGNIRGAPARRWNVRSSAPSAARPKRVRAGRVGRSKVGSRPLRLACRRPARKAKKCRRKNQLNRSDYPTVISTSMSPRE